MSRSSELRRELTEEVWEFLDKYSITNLEAVDVDEGNSPIVMEDKSTLQDDYTLDRIRVDIDYDTIEVDASGCYGNDTFSLYDLDCETIEGILDWLKDNEETIAELSKEEKSA